MLALPSKYHGLIAKLITAQMKKPFRTVRYLGNRAAISFPAGSEFSKIELNIAEYEKQAAIRKHPARLPGV